MNDIQPGDRVRVLAWEEMLTLNGAEENSNLGIISNKNSGVTFLNRMRHLCNEKLTVDHLEECGTEFRLIFTPEDMGKTRKGDGMFKTYWLIMPWMVEVITNQKPIEAAELLDLI